MANTSTEKSGKSGKSSLVGTQLGDYRLTELLASGGMARIYRGVDVNLGRQAAVKVLTQELLDNDETLTKRFKLEAKAVAAMEHDNIISIYQYGEQDELYFLVMKLVEGRDLADTLNDLKRQGKLMPPRKMLDLLKQVASALDFAHQHDIIHRDVKPSNILIDKDEKAILTDFGLVLMQKVDKTMGTAFGTPRYISPEQALASERAVPQSDVYSLAVIVYEILTGSMLFKADTAMQIAISHINDPPPPPRNINPNIPRAVDREILKALSKDPQKRHKTATEFMQALEEGYGEELDTQSTVPPEMVRSDTPVFKTRPDVGKKGARPAPADDWESWEADQQTEKVPAEGKLTRKERRAQRQAEKAAIRQAKKEARAARKKRSRIPALLLGVLVIPLVAAGALLAVNGDLLSSGDDGDDPGVVVPPPTPAPTQPALDLSVVPVDGEAARLHYDFNIFVLRNDSDTAFDLDRLVFSRSDGANLYRISGGSSTEVAPGECLVIRVQASSRPDLPDDWACDDEAISTTLNADNVFWRVNTTTTDFVVRRGDQAIAACAMVDRFGDDACDFAWPETVAGDN